MAVYPLGVLGPWEIVIIAFLILLLFGGKKIPELMRGLGKGVKSFKEGINDVTKEVNDVTKEVNNVEKEIKSVGAVPENKEKSDGK